ncbi:hypothetical protein LJR232_004677 [Aquipseudomonas alcaligenes]
MKPVRIVAQWAEDERQTLVIVALQADDMSIATTVEAFGYVKDYDDEDRMYVRYPFVLEEYSDTEALMDWGALDDTRTLIDLYGRRIVPGEALIRNERGERYDYQVVSVEPFVPA